MAHVIAGMAERFLRIWVMLEKLILWLYFWIFHRDVDTFFFGNKIFFKMTLVLCTLRERGDHMTQNDRQLKQTNKQTSADQLIFLEIK